MFLRTKIVKTVSVNVNASPVVLNLSKDGVQFNCANLGQVESGSGINVFTGLSTDEITIDGEYLDRNGVTHGASWSFIPNPGTTATVGVGVVVFFFTGIPTFAF